MAYKIKAKWKGKRTQTSKSYKTESKAKQVAKRDKEYYQDMREQYPEAYKKLWGSSRTPKFEVVKAR